MFKFYVLQSTDGRLFSTRVPDYLTCVAADAATFSLKEDAEEAQLEAEALSGISLAIKAASMIIS